MLAQKPYLQFISAKHITNDHIVRAVVSEFVGPFGDFATFRDDDLVRIEQARKLNRNLFASFRRTRNFGGFGDVRRSGRVCVSTVLADLSRQCVRELSRCDQGGDSESSHGPVFEHGE